MRSLALLLLLSTVSLQAADGSLSLSPAVVMLRGDHGQSSTQLLTMRNGTSRPFSFDLVAQDVVVRAGKRAFVDAGSIAGSIAATAVFSQGHVEVAPGQTVRVTMTITLPPETGQRAVLALFRGTNRVMSGNVPVMASLGTLLTFSITDELALTTSALSVRPQSATRNLGVSQACTNSGREPLVAKGAMAIVDAEGVLVGRSAMAPHRLLPGESAELGSDYAGELGPGRYRVFLSYDYEGRSTSNSAEVEIQ